jgi:hypothetical protein
MTIRVLISVSLLLPITSLGTAAEPEPAPPPREQGLSLTKAAAPLVDYCRRAEAYRMLEAILGGSRMGPGEGWFGPAQNRYGWEWLKKRFPPDKDGRIARKQFDGSDGLFKRLDRNADGAISRDDLDWSDSSPFWQQDRMARGMLKRADTTGDGKISAEEWSAFFAKAAKDEKFLDPDALRQILFPAQPPRPAGPPPDMPTPSILLKGLFSGEIGSLLEGPDLGERAPDFALKAHKGEQLITLSDFRGKKPVVLIFGSFT